MPRCPRCGRPADGLCEVCRGGKTLFLGSIPAEPVPSAPGAAAELERREQVVTPPTVRSVSEQPRPRPEPAPIAEPPRRAKGLDERLSVGIRLSTTLRNLVARAPQAHDGSRSASSSRGIWIALLIGIVAGLATVAVWWAWPSRRSGVVRVAKDGSQIADLRCSRCDDGTVVRIGEARATIHDGRARLALASSLAPTTRELVVEAASPSGRSTNLEFDVRVCGRLSPDLSTLAEDDPALAVVVEVPVGASVIVDGVALSLDAEGRARHRVALADELLGDRGTLQPLRRSLPFTLSAAECGDQAGQFVIELPIVPLRVTAPSASITLDRATFMLAGKTEPGATVTVEGRKIALNDRGEFAQKMTISKLGERVITVRSTVPGRAPRLVRRRIRRVANLEQEALSSARSIPSSLDEVSSQGGPRSGARFALRGSAKEVGVVGHGTHLVIKTDSCSLANCDVGVQFGGSTDVAVGEQVLVIGQWADDADSARSLTAELIAPLGRGSTR